MEIEKQYTDKDYADKAVEANAKGEMLYVYTHSIDVEKQVPEYETVTETVEIPYIDDDGNELSYTQEVKKEVIKGYHTENETKEIAELVIAPVGYYECYENNFTDGTLNENYEEEQAQKEKERIQRLSLTKREVFLALYHAKGITPEQLKAQITDPEALIEFEYANEYFRFNPLLDTIGVKLGYTSDDLDYLFINKELPKKES